MLTIIFKKQKSMNKLVLQYLSNNTPSPQNSSRTSSLDSNQSQQSTNKYKTQLCRTFQERGQCPYGHKCRFAHGKQDLVQVDSDPTKKKRCNGFWTNGCCSYGRRCKFGHQQMNWQDTACLLAIEACCGKENQVRSKLMKILQ